MTNDRILLNVSEQTYLNQPVQVCSQIRLQTILWENPSNLESYQLDFTKWTHLCIGYIFFSVVVDFCCLLVFFATILYWFVSYFLVQSSLSCETTFGKYQKTGGLWRQEFKITVPSGHTVSWCWVNIESPAQCLHDFPLTRSFKICILSSNVKILFVFIINTSQKKLYSFYLELCKPWHIYYMI